MTTTGLQQDVWVLVCDGKKALLLQNVGDRTYPKLETREHLDHPDPPTHEMGTDSPGRTVSSTGSRRSATEGTDFHLQAQQQFLESVVARVEAQVAAGRIKKLIIVAPPGALGMIRHALSPSVRALVQAEIDKDLVKLPLYEIEKHLS